MIGLFVIFGMLAIRILMYFLAFPEVSAFLLLSVGILFPTYGVSLFDPTLGAEQLNPFEVVYPFAKFINDHILPLQPAFRISFIILCVATYIMLAKLVNIKGIYIIQIAGVIFVGYLAYLLMSKGFNLSVIWSVLLTVVITFFASAMRYSVFNPSTNKNINDRD